MLGTVLIKAPQKVCGELLSLRCTVMYKITDEDSLHSDMADAYSIILDILFVYLTRG